MDNEDGLYTCMYMLLCTHTVTHNMGTTVALQHFDQNTTKVYINIYHAQQIVKAI